MSFRCCFGGLHFWLGGDTGLFAYPPGNSHLTERHNLRFEGVSLVDHHERMTTKPTDIVGFGEEITRIGHAQISIKGCSLGAFIRTSRDTMAEVAVIIGLLVLLGHEVT